MASLAGTPDLLDLPGMDVAAVSENAQQRALDLATGRIIADLGWDPRQSVRTLTFRELGYGEAIVLRAQNVTAVAVTVDGGALAGTSVEWTTPSSVLYLDRAISRTGSITYTAGWPTGSIPSVIVDACADLAADLLQNPRRVRSWQVDDASETYGNDLRAGDPRLDAYRLPPTIS